MQTSGSAKVQANNLIQKHSGGTALLSIASTAPGVSTTYTFAGRLSVQIPVNGKFRVKVPTGINPAEGALPCSGTGVLAISMTCNYV